MSSASPGGALQILLVYLVALAIAFGLVGTIRARSPLTRERGDLRGDFSVRPVRPGSIGDLARSFDGMASSIEGLWSRPRRRWAGKRDRAHDPAEAALSPETALPDSPSWRNSSRRRSEAITTTTSRCLTKVGRHGRRRPGTACPRAFSRDGWGPVHAIESDWPARRLHA
jgi:hypothetical protein